MTEEGKRITDGPAAIFREIPLGEQLLAMRVIAQAKDDLLRPKFRQEALEFLKGHGEENKEMLLFWCRIAGVDPVSVMSMVRKVRLDGTQAASAAGAVHDGGLVAAVVAWGNDDLHPEGEESLEEGEAEGAEEDEWLR